MCIAGAFARIVLQSDMNKIATTAEPAKERAELRSSEQRDVPVERSHSG